MNPNKNSVKSHKNSTNILNPYKNSVKDHNNNKNIFKYFYLDPITFSIYIKKYFLFRYFKYIYLTRWYYQHLWNEENSAKKY